MRKDPASTIGRGRANAQGWVRCPRGDGRGNTLPLGGSKRAFTGNGEGEETEKEGQTYLSAGLAFLR